LLWSLKHGDPAGNNPWGAAGLEWQIESPPTTQNFDKIPTVTEEAYNYGPVEEVILG
jgi:cytochrome c oxidase subunit I